MLFSLLEGISCGGDITRITSLFSSSSSSSLSSSTSSAEEVCSSSSSSSSNDNRFYLPLCSQGTERNSFGGVGHHAQGQNLNLTSWCAGSELGARRRTYGGARPGARRGARRGAGFALSLHLKRRLPHTHAPMHARTPRSRRSNAENEVVLIVPFLLPPLGQLCCSPLCSALLCCAPSRLVLVAVPLVLVVPEPLAKSFRRSHGTEVM